MRDERRRYFPIGVFLAVIGVVVAAIPEDTSAIALAKALADEAPFVIPLSLRSEL